MSVSICFIFLGAYIECIYVNELNILFLYSSYYYYITSFFVFCFTLFFKRVFQSDICIVTHAFFCLFMSQFIEVNRDGRWWITNGRPIWIRPRDNSVTSIWVSVAWTQSRVPKLITKELENVVWLCTQEEDKHSNIAPVTIRSFL